MPADNILRRIRHLFSRNADAGATDADLLRRFADARDEAAFELLVWRHAGLVLHVCRQMLRDEHAVEDAFQATFLVLFRKAGAIVRSEALPGWLHQVAFRVAQRARPRPFARTGVDLDGVPAPASAGVEEDTRRLLHEEIARLPAKYRLPIVCCYLEGKTLTEVAGELGWPKGTVAGRLARAREVLHTRLTRRGVALAGLGLTSHLSAGALSAGMTHRITTLLVALRSLGASALSPSVVILAEGVLNAMFWKSMQWVAVVAVLVSGVGLAGFWSGHSGNAQESAATKPKAAPGAIAGAKDEKPAAEEEEAVRPEDLMKEAENRAIARRNLRSLAFAFHNYHNTYNHLPPPAITDKAGKPLLSWRVAILPYIDQDALYKQFKLDEPWDSVHNKKLLAKMPRIFAPIGVKPKESNSTFYQVFVGPGALYTAYHLPFGEGMRKREAGMGALGGGGGFAGGVGAQFNGGGFPGGGGFAGGGGLGGGMGEGGGMAPNRRMGGPPSFEDFPSGANNTILIAEAGMAVPWTKPEDIPYDAKKPIPTLGGQFSTVINVAFADGNTRSLLKTLDAARFHAGISPQGGGIIDDGSAETPVQQKLLDDLRRKNIKLKEEATILTDILAEVKTEMKNLRWALEQEKMLAADPTATALKSENEKLEKSLEKGRDEARKLMLELRKMKQEMRKKKK